MEDEDELEEDAEMEEVEEMDEMEEEEDEDVEYGMPAQEAYEDDEDEEEAPIPEVDAAEFMNPLLECYRLWMAQAPKDMSKIFHPSTPDERRAELLDLLPLKAQRKYAWAIPDERAIRAMYQYGPIVEIGAGKGYWGYLLRKFTKEMNAMTKKGEKTPCAHRPELLASTVYTGYDFMPYTMAGETVADLEATLAQRKASSILTTSKRGQGKKSSLGALAESKRANYRSDEFPAWDKVLKGGPEMLAKHTDRTLFLCYPDDFEFEAASMALKCLKMYKGDTIVLVGEAFGQTAQSDNPWGRSAGADFQQHLAVSFHKVLQLPLPSWPGSQDTLTVWRRTMSCTLDDMEFKYIPQAEMINLVQSCPSTAHIVNTKGSIMNDVRGKPEAKPKAEEKPKAVAAATEAAEPVAKKASKKVPASAEASKPAKAKKEEAPVVSKAEKSKKRKTAGVDAEFAMTETDDNAPKKPKIPVAKKLLQMLKKK
jgi:hypothetical protein